MRLSRILVVPFVLGACTLVAHADPAAPPTPGAAREPFFDRADALYMAASAAGVAATAVGDRWAWRQSQDDPGSALHRVSRFAERLGDPTYVGPALVASYLAGRVGRLPNLSAPSARVAGAALGASVLCEGLKLAVGRARPGRVEEDPLRFQPFNVHDASFPSGHTTFAFAAAAAIDQETDRRWVPWVVYPAAATVGWARVHENRHWLSDVAAGAALGFWAGRKIDRLERQRGLFERAHFLATGSRRNFRLGFKTTF